jgi:hypothetical protein
MLIEVIRAACGKSCTLGKMYIDGVDMCYTLEDVVREEKIYGETAIPAGRYRVDITFSNRFQRDLPLLIGVENFTGVRIHPGNSDKQTHGCILTGTGIGSDGNSLTESRAAFERVFSEIRDAIEHGEEVWIEVRDM